MSIAIMQQWPDRALIVTDTISSHHPEDPSRRTGFGMKVWTLPHMNMAFAFRGAAPLAFRWHQRLITSGECRDIEDAHELARNELRAIVDDAAERYGVALSGDFYHFGFPHGSDQIVSYVYAPDNDYRGGGRTTVPESADEDVVQVNVTVAPAPVTFKMASPMDIPDYIDLATLIREENANRMVDEPIAIGGDLFATFVENWKIRTVLWHRFPDYDETWDAIRARNVLPHRATAATGS